MKTNDDKIEYIKAVMGHAKLSALFRDIDLYNYIASVLDLDLLPHEDKFEIMDTDKANRKKLEKRIDVFKTIAGSLAKFETEELKDYIMKSIETEMWLAYNIGRYGNNQ